MRLLNCQLFLGYFFGDELFFGYFLVMPIRYVKKFKKRTVTCHCERDNRDVLGIILVHFASSENPAFQLSQSQYAQYL